MLRRPWPKIESTPLAPRSSRRTEQDLDDLRAGQVRESLGEKRHRAADRRRRKAGSGPVELRPGLVGRAIAIADAPQDNFARPLPALFEKSESWLVSTPPPDATPTEPAMITFEPKCCAGIEREGIGIIAFRRLAVVARGNHDHDARIDRTLERGQHCEFGAPPPSDMLITLRAGQPRRVDAPGDRVVEERAAVLRCCSEPGSSARKLAIVASKATPSVSEPLRAAAATALTAVPWPSSSLTPRLPATSSLAGRNPARKLGEVGIDAAVDDRRSSRPGRSRHA